MKTSVLHLRHGHHPDAPAGVVNVRVANRDEGLDALAASINSIGLLQPLVVVTGADDFRYVADGNRRLAAIMRLVLSGVFPQDHEVDVVELDALNAREAGLAANLNQVAMHEADQTAAFSEMEQAGTKPKAIAARFGVSLPHVKKLLALGSVSPRILDAWRSGKHGVGIDEVKAFTLAPSIEEQERVYDKLSGRGGSFWSSQVRQELGADHSTATMLKRVGLDAYKAAGGAVIKDLFGDNTAVSDKALLQRLSDESLIARRDELRTEGWAWVEIESDLPDSARYSWSTLHSSRRDLTQEEAARLREIEAMIAAKEDWSVSDETFQALTAEHRAIERSLTQQPGDEDKARSGCVVSWHYDGTIHVRDYVLRPEDVKAAKVKAVAADGSIEPETKGLSSALVDRLSTQMTQAVQDAFETAPRAALAGLLAGATCKDPWHAPVRLRMEGLGHEKAKVADNERFEVLFERFIGMSDEDLMANLGRVLARGLDLRIRVPGSGETAGCAAESRSIQALVGAIDAGVLTARMADRFDAPGFFASAPKSVTIAAIEEACGSDAAARARKLKKGEIVALAIETVIPTGWIPREIRWPGYAGPGHQVPLDEAA